MAAEGHCFFFLQGSIGVPVHLNQDQYIYIYQWCYTQREWHSSNFLPESWHAHESSCLTQKKQTKLCPHSYRCPLESRDREVVISCYIMLFFYVSHFGWLQAPWKIAKFWLEQRLFGYGQISMIRRLDFHSLRIPFQGDSSAWRLCQRQFVPKAWGREVGMVPRPCLVSDVSVVSETAGFGFPSLVKDTQG